MSRELIEIRTIAKRAFDTCLVFNRFHQFSRLKTVNHGLLCRLCLSSRIRNVEPGLPIGENSLEPHASNEFIGRGEGRVRAGPAQLRNTEVEAFGLEIQKWWAQI